jgi:hypothetical protein
MTIHDDAVHLGASSRLIDLARSTPADLVATMRRGSAPAREALVGWEFRGVNTAAFLRRAGADRFIKGFTELRTGVRGYNRRIGRGGLTDAWIVAGDPEPEPFAFYDVRPVDPESRDNRYLNALLLDYGAGGNRRGDPSNPIRDYLVQVDADEPDLLLGHAFIALGPWRIPVSFFALERLRRASV